MWDTEANQEELTDKFFTEYFDGASTAMRKYYDSLCAYTQTVLGNRQKAEQYDLTCFENVVSKDLWSLTKLKEWQGYIDKAYTAISSLRTTDSARYEVLSRRIKIESMAVRYLYLELYVTTDNPTNATALRKAFKADAEALSCGEFGQGAPITQLWSRWGIS